jgi:5-methylcytosine-specific restriction endonuclease McrA
MVWDKHILNKNWEKLKQRFGGKCRVCGSLTGLQFAHVKDTKLSGAGRGKFARYYDIMNNPDSYVLLCHTCHRAFDRGDIDMKKLEDVV